MPVPVSSTNIFTHSEAVDPGYWRALPPESFIQLLAASDDLEIHTVMFSQQLIQNAGMGKNMMDKFYVIGKHYVFPLSKVVSTLYMEMFTFLSHLYKEIGEK